MGMLTPTLVLRVRIYLSLTARRIGGMMRSEIVMGVDELDLSIALIQLGLSFCRK